MQQQIDALSSAIRTLITSQANALTEYELINTLQEKDLLPVDKNLLSDTTSLFRTHFLIFHCLYLIDQQLCEEGLGRIHIDVLEIRYLPSKDAHIHLASVDSLRAYYLDLTQLQKTDAAAIEEMLNGFWTAYLRNEGREAALQTLGLSDPIDDSEITAHYRRLAARHHPDRGGDEQRLQEINQAYSRLLKRA